jgi:hypothetical protein
MAMLSRRTSTTAIRWRQRVLTQNHTITALDHGWRLVCDGITVTLSSPAALGEGFECQLLARDELVRLGPTDYPDDGHGETHWAQSHVIPAADGWPEGRHNCLMHFRVIDGRLLSETLWATEPYSFGP